MTTLRTTFPILALASAYSGLRFTGPGLSFHQTFARFVLHRVAMARASEILNGMQQMIAERSRGRYP